MPELNLTEDEIRKLTACLSENREPPEEIAAKLFPTLFTRLQRDARFDVKRLNLARIPTIEYEGKRPEAAILGSAAIFGGSTPLQLERCFDGGRLTKDSQLSLFKESNPSHGVPNWRNLIVQGDNLQFLKTCYLNQDPLIKDKVKGKVQLVYIDPPFATQGDFGSKQGEDSYSDKVDRAEFIEAVRERLVFIREMLADTGCIFVHLDQKMQHYIKIILDEVFGRDNFRNQIVWRNTNSHNKATTFGRIHQNILYYSKTDRIKFNKWRRPPFKKYIEQNFSKGPDGKYYAKADLTAPETRSGESGKPWRGYNPTTQGRHWAIPAFVYDLIEDDISNYGLIEKLDYLYSKQFVYFPDKDGGQPRILKPLTDDAGNFVMDIWAFQPYTEGIYEGSDEGIDADASWTIPGNEDYGYPTQKPEGLLARILRSCSDDGDLVMDIFGGSGTTAAVAEKLNRRWIVSDFGKHSIYTIQKRIIEIADSQMLGRSVDKKKKKPYGEKPRPFCVASVGAYDFTRIMHLRENRNAYVSFVLELFGITDREGDFDKKFKLTNIYAQKDGHPVMIFPIWDDEYLKKIRIDDEFLRDLLKQAGSRLKGDFYIITPETCTRLGDTSVKNNGGHVHFKFLTFPYKILEDVSRNFQLVEQPSSPANINNLVSSVGFYFNQPVAISVRKADGGFEIKKFETPIVNAEGKRFEGLDGLAMLLIDADYDGEVFKIDAAIYQKDIKDEKVKLPGLTAKSALIAVDRHGNESKITMVK